jgi:hypothetical protein
LFSGRYKAPFVDGSGNGYLKTVCDYVHLNPARANLLSPAEKLREFPWSSFPQYLLVPTARPNWLRVDHLLGEHGIQADTAAGRAEFEKRLELRRASEEPEDFAAVLNDWCLGSDAFREDLLAQMEHQKGAEHFGPEIQESALEKARRLLSEELDKLGWKEEHLLKHPKGALQKVEIALRLRKETTMTLAWVAEHLHMGTKSHLAHLLYWKARKQPLYDTKN